VTSLRELSDEERAEYLMTHEVSQQLGIKQGTVRRAFRDGLLDGRVLEPVQGWRILLITPASVEAYRAEHLGRRGRRSNSEKRKAEKAKARKQTPRLAAARRARRDPSFGAASRLVDARTDGDAGTDRR
jgi:hypothetical protein